MQNLDRGRKEMVDSLNFGFECLSHVWWGE